MTYSFSSIDYINPLFSKFCEIKCSYSQDHKHDCDVYCHIQTLTSLVLSHILSVLPFSLGEGCPLICAWLVIMITYYLVMIRPVKIALLCLYCSAIGNYYPSLATRKTKYNLKSFFRVWGNSQVSQCVLCRYTRGSDHTQRGVVAGSCNPDTEEAETGKTLGFPGQ